MSIGFALVKLRRFRFEERQLNTSLIDFAFNRIAGRDKFLQTQLLIVLCKITSKVAPFGIIARQQYGLATKHIRIVIKIGFHFGLYIIKHGIEFILLGSLCIR